MPGDSRPSSLLSSFLFSQLAPSLATSEDDMDADMDSVQLNPAPPSLLSSALPPSLLKDDPLNLSAGGRPSSIPLRPRRLWNVQDTNLKPIPAYYPPLDPTCSVLVTDVSPSLVAVRITECLRKRSIAAEYDDDSITAWCMTVDRTHFTIQLYRGNKSASSVVDPLALSSGSPAVVVECQRQSGSSTSFHVACHAILQAAKGMDSGDDNREVHRTNGMEFQSLSPSAKRRKLVHGSPLHISSSLEAETAFEAAMALLQKDRLECQQLGLERLVNLTNSAISGQDISRYVSRRLLQDDWLLDSFLMHPEAERAMDAVQINTTRRCNTIKKGDEHDTTTALIRSFLESSTAVSPSPRVSYSTEDRNLITAAASSSSDTDDLSLDELRQEARLRALALRVLCNALNNASEVGELQNILLASNSTGTYKRKIGGASAAAAVSSEDDHLSRLIQPPFLLSLVQDMQGASRPPSVSETGYKLASVHEAALAIRCLRLLAGSTDGAEDRRHSPSSPHSRVRDFLRNEVILESLELARSCGRATHSILQNEAERTYIQLTEDARSC
jgi:hypothetical protein